MRKSSTPPVFLMRKKNKKHIKKSKSFTKRAKALKNIKAQRLRRQKKIAASERIDISSTSRLAKYFDKLTPSQNNIFRLKKDKLKVKIPKDFNIYEDPEKVINFVSKFYRSILNPKLKTLEVKHNNVNSCVASEMMLGLVANEVNTARDSTLPLKVKGMIRDDGTHYEMLNSVGIVAELKQNIPEKCVKGDVLYFRKDNYLNESSSGLANDVKNETAKNLVKHLKACLSTQELELRGDVGKDIEMCIGEVLDNAHEHCGGTAPIWFVRSYLNTTVADKRFFDLTVMNFGLSISDTFNSLEDDSEAKSLAMEYVNYHEGKVDRNVLTTVSAMQGNISSKKDSDSTRGQGTIRLIETFEGIYKSYEQLRGNYCESGAQMNIITGNTVLKFDGKFDSVKILNEFGEEDFIFPFNACGDLKVPPSTDHVLDMKGANFPGMLLNIRVPLTGSTTPLDDEEHNDANN